MHTVVATNRLRHGIWHTLQLLLEMSSAMQGLYGLQYPSNLAWGPSVNLLPFSSGSVWYVPCSLAIVGTLSHVVMCGCCALLVTECPT